MKIDLNKELEERKEKINETFQENLDLKMQIDTLIYMKNKKQDEVIDF